MAITILTDKPAALLANITKQIEEKKIKTWSIYKNEYFTHTPPQWINKAWLRPRILEEKLIFNIVPPQKTTLSSEIYAVYHGRFIEMLLAHVDSQFRSASASALATSGDIIKVAN